MGCWTVALIVGLTVFGRPVFIVFDRLIHGDPLCRLLGCGASKVFDSTPASSLSASSPVEIP